MMSSEVMASGVTSKKLTAMLPSAIAPPSLAVMTTLPALWL